MRVATFIIACSCALASTRAQGPAGGGPPAGETRAEPAVAASAQSALERLELPGIKINLAERSVDVAGEICLDEGTLELIACRKETKEHESIIATEAKGIHIHTALLLLGAKPGNPAMRKQLGTEGAEVRWVEVPPAGDPIEVSLVIGAEGGGAAERPISEFIEAADPAGAAAAGDGEQAEEKKFPTHTFLFAGSLVVPTGEGPRTYMGDRSGNLISIATFGDELLCLPEVHSHENGSLLWQIDRTHLPKVGTRVTLRLRPKPKP